MDLPILDILYHILYYEVITVFFFLFFFFLLHPPIDKNLGHSQFGAILTTSSLNIHVKVFFLAYDFIFLGQCLQLGLLVDSIVICLVL